MSFRARIGIFVAVIAVAALLVVYGVVRNRPSSSPSASPSASQAQPTQGQGQPDADAQTAGATTGDSRILIVYFSRTEGVYGGDLDVGNTKRVADFIQEHTGGDEYEIIPLEEYPSDYDETTEVAQQEQRDDARPAIRDPLPDVSDYDVVFVGAPVWWGEYPMVVRTFLDGVDLNGKTVIPFTTHEGSGLGNTAQQLETQYPNATVREGFAVRGTESANSQGDVDSWLDELGY